MRVETERAREFMRQVCAYAFILIFIYLPWPLTVAIGVWFPYRDYGYREGSLEYLCRKAWLISILGGATVGIAIALAYWGTGPSWFLLGCCVFGYALLGRRAETIYDELTKQCNHLDTNYSRWYE